ncbi:metallo-dependent phosphatase-like protein [Tanacetum coccineum]
MEGNNTLHHVGLLSDSGVHSRLDQLQMLLNRASERGAKKIRVHVLTDGRDVLDGSSVGFPETLKAELASLRSKGIDAQVASSGGRNVLNDGSLINLPRGDLLLIGDWFDGLQTYMRYICHKSWLGGWLMPQKKSYFALQLPKRWWVFGLDLALHNDIDDYQFKFFLQVIQEKVKQNDSVIVMTHEPNWILDWYWDEVTGKNVSHVIRDYLKGRCKLRMAGDLHHYMRQILYMLLLQYTPFFRSAANEHATSGSSLTGDSIHDVTSVLRHRKRTRKDVRPMLA